MNQIEKNHLKYLLGIYVRESFPALFEDFSVIEKHSENVASEIIKFFEALDILSLKPEEFVANPSKT